MKTLVWIATGLIASGVGWYAGLTLWGNPANIPVFLVLTIIYVFALLLCRDELVRLT